MFLPPRSPRRIHSKGVMRWETPRSAKSPAGENPACVRVSHPRRTKPCVEGGDELGEARGRDVLGRNESECIEPRKDCRYSGWLIHRSGRQHEGLRTGKHALALSGV